MSYIASGNLYFEKLHSDFRCTPSSVIFEFYLVFFSTFFTRLVNLAPTWSNLKERCDSIPYTNIDASTGYSLISSRRHLASGQFIWCAKLQISLVSIYFSIFNYEVPWVRVSFYFYDCSWFRDNWYHIAKDKAARLCFLCKNYYPSWWFFNTSVWFSRYKIKSILCGRVSKQFWIWSSDFLCYDIRSSHLIPIVETL